MSKTVITNSMSRLSNSHFRLCITSVLPHEGSVEELESIKETSKKSTSGFLSAPAPLRHHQVLNKNG